MTWESICEKRDRIANEVYADLDKFVTVEMKGRRSEPAKMYKVRRLRVELIMQAFNLDYIGARIVVLLVEKRLQAEGREL